LGKLNLSADFYNIKVDGRVLFSSQIKSTDGNLDGSDPVEQILLNNDVIALQFFINAVNTKTSGMDLVLDYPNIPLGKGKFGANLSANFNKTEIDGEVANPPVLEQYGYDIFDHRQEILITDSRPKSKIALGLNYAVNGFNFHLNNTRFGEVTVASEDGSNDQIYSPKIVTDFNFGYQFSKKFDASLAINNVFDVYPDILRQDLRSANGRFLYSNEVTQMGIMGTNYNLMFRFKF
jgi:iron complex outermembrane receptor protein